MNTETQRLKKNCKCKPSGRFLTRLLLVLSFLQAHWIPLACAAGTVAAAAMFGDKSYLANVINQSDTMLKEGKAEDVAELLKTEIAEYNIWRQTNLEQAKLTDAYLPELYYQLAKSQEATGIPNTDIIDNYKKAVFSMNNAGNAFAWLYDNLTEQEYSDLVKDYTRIVSQNKCQYNQADIAEQLESSKNWPAFKKFMDAFFDEVKEPAKYAKILGSGLAKNGLWLKEYIDYCHTRPDLLEYFFEKDYELVEQYKQQENFAKVSEIYENILKTSGSEVDTSQLKFDICQAQFNAGEYQTAISKLDEFISEYRATHRSLVKDAILMKGRAHIQLGEIDKATDEFFTLMIEYPETKQAPESNFFIGYCLMLQGKFDQAKEALYLAIVEHPESIYASKAKLCLIRIESMTK